MNVCETIAIDRSYPEKGSFESSLILILGKSLL